MLSFLKRVILFGIISWIPLLSWGNNLSEIHSAAERYYGEGSYDEAITEFKRYLYFSSTDSARYHDIHQKLGNCYAYQNQNGQAIAEYNKAMAYADSDSAYYRSALAVVSLYIASEQFERAQQQILNLQIGVSDSTLMRKVSLYKGINELHRFNWEASHKAFRQYFTDPAGRVILDSLFHQAGNLSLKSPAFARILSAILPGLGQIYGGDYENGIRAFVLNGLLFYNFAYYYNRNHLVNTVLSGILIANRYIMGNREHAAGVVKDHNRQLQSSYAQETMKGILHVFKRVQ